LNKSGLLLIVTNRDAQEEITNEQPKKIYAGEWKLISYTFSHLPPGVQITGQAS
jgi:hypothetical protein